jgi:hypothetical protein
MSLFEENAEVLENMARNGSELSSPRSVEFSYVFAETGAAEAFARQAGSEGFDVSMEKVELGEAWDVTASKVLVPTCENITEAEELLNAIAQPHEGRSDGWGFFNT